MSVETCVAGAALDGATGVGHEARPPDKQQPRRRCRQQPTGFFTIQQLAARSPLGRSGLYVEVARKRLRAHRWRGRLLVSEEDFRLWLAAEPVPAGPAPMVLRGRPRKDRAADDAAVAAVEVLNG